MGIHDIEKVDAQAKTDTPSQKKQPSWIIPTVVLVLLVAAGLTYQFTKNDYSENVDGSLDGLKDHLEQLGIDDKEIVLPFKITSDVTALVKKLAGQKRGRAALQNMLEELGAMRKAGRYTAYHQREPQTEPPLTASKAAKLLNGEPQKTWKATSYELATLLLAMARSIGIDAHLAQIHTFKGENKPADLYGKLGRYGVAVGEKTKEHIPPLYDPWAQRFGQSAQGDFEVMSDDEATAPFYNIEALGLLLKKETAQALKKNDLAIKLGPKCALYRTTRGLIFAASGAPGEAIAEFEKAIKLSDDALTHTNLAEVMLASDPTGARAEAEIQAALSKSPDYFRAHTVLAMIHMLRMEFDEAATELTIAQRLAPASPSVAITWAQLYAYQHDGTKAIEKGQEAMRLAQNSLSSMMAMAGIYKATARFDEMRKLLGEVLDKYSDRNIKEEIKMIFNYEPDEDDDEDAGKPSSDAGAYKLTLDSEESGFGSGLRLTGDGNDQKSLGIGSGLKLNLGGSQ